MRYYALILLLLTSFCVEGQKKDRKLAGLTTDEIFAMVNDTCGYKANYSKARLRRLHPFNKSKKVILISYIPQDLVEHWGIKGKDTLGYRCVKEVITLTQVQTDSLNSIIHNIGYKGIRLMYDGTNCPPQVRNSVLFFNKAGKEIDALHIDFACNRSGNLESKIGIGEECVEKYDILQNWFIHVGMKFGTVDRE